MDVPSRQSKITDEHREEARRLKAIWERTLDERRLRGEATQEAFGERYNIGNQAAVGFFLNGKTPLSAKAARGFANGLRCKVADFSPRLAALLEPAGPGVSCGMTPEAQRLLTLYYSLGPADRTKLVRIADAMQMPEPVSPSLTPGPPIREPAGGR